MVIYEKARTTVRTKQVGSEEFEVKVGVHQGSVLSLLLFVAVMEVVTQKVREGLPWELLYADDLVLVAQSIEKLREKVQRWKACMESKGLKMNIDKTKVMRSGKGSGDIVKTGKLPCAACGKGVMSNCIQCTECCEWVHRRCRDTKAPLIKVQGFRCRLCLTGRDNKDRIKDLVLENGEVIKGVGQFCYLGGVLNGEGGSSMASINRVRSDWKKFREL